MVSAPSRRNRVAAGRSPRAGALASVGAAALLVGCAGWLDTVPPRPGPVEDPEIAEAEPPRLEPVRTRPRLTYSVEQRRAIADELASDRANARYAAAVERAELGLGDLPPPPAETARGEAGQANAAGGSSPGRGGDAAGRDGERAEALVEAAVRRFEQDASLGDFLDELEASQRAPRPAAQAAAEARARAAAGPGMAAGLEGAEASSAAEQSEGAAAESSGEQDGDDPRMFGTDRVASTQADAPPDPEAAADAATASADEGASVDERDEGAAEGAGESEAAGDAASRAPSLPFAVRFPEGGVEVGGADAARLRALARSLAEKAGGVRLVAEGASPVEALDRGRTVAVRLLDGGLGSDRIELEIGGAGSAVVLYPAADTGG